MITLGHEHPRVLVWDVDDRTVGNLERRGFARNTGSVEDLRRWIRFRRETDEDLCCDLLDRCGSELGSVAIPGIDPQAGYRCWRKPACVDAGHTSDYRQAGGENCVDASRGWISLHFLAGRLVG